MEFFLEEFTMSRMDTLYLELVMPKLELAAVEFLEFNTGENMLYLCLGDPSALEPPIDSTLGDIMRLLV